MRITIVICSFLLFGSTISGFAQRITYVKSNATGRNDGSSWGNAFTDLGMAIARTANGEIWIAGGVYLPTLDSMYKVPANRRDATFHLHNGLQLFGGFDGSEEALSQRDLRRNPTVLSGDFEHNDINDYHFRQLWLHPSRQENAYRVVNIFNAGTVTLDGFTIQSGNTKFSIRGDTVKEILAQGAGLQILAIGKMASNNVTVRNCQFRSNASWMSAGGLKHFARFGSSSRLSLVNCLFFNCQGIFAGGVGCASDFAKLETDISNCTFTHNYALYCGGSVSTTIEPQFKPSINRTIIRNSIFWGNDANGCRPDVDDYNAETIVSCCDMEYPYGGVGNFKMKPFFLDPVRNDRSTGSSDDDFSILAFCPRDNRDSCLPPVIFNSFLIRGKPVQLGADLNQSPVISLQSAERSFGLVLALVGFTLSPDKAIEYRLDGYDQEWHLAGQIDTVLYNDLPGGAYQFHLRSVGSSAEKTLYVKIAPYFWETGWFKLLMVIAVALVFILAYIIYQNRRLRKKEIELQHAQTLAVYIQKTTASEMKALRAQMNPHFIFNSLNSINAYILRQMPAQASGYLTEFAHLMRQILDNSARETIPLEQEITFLESYLKTESLRLENKLTYHIRVADSVDTFETEIPSMILQPYVENAIWHGISPKSDGGHVLIGMERAPDGALLLSVEDNGVGREQGRALRAQRGSTRESKGLKITEERLALYDQKHKTKSVVKTMDLKDERGRPIGTRVEIRMAPSAKV